jgi:hypothetical protein
MTWLITPGQPVPVDPYRSQVSLLLHGDGTNGSTTITDNSPSPKTVTAVGNAQISTAQSKFGGSSIAFDGTGDYLTIPSAALQPEGFDYTVEFFVNLTTASTYQTLYSLPKDESGSGIAPFRIDVDAARIRPLIGDASNSSWFSIATGSITLSSTTWYHIAITKSGTTIRSFIDGVLDLTLTGAPATHSITSPSARIGYNNVADPLFTTGYIDDLRITKGVARYTANFTPPTAAFPDI